MKKLGITLIGIVILVLACSEIKEAPISETATNTYVTEKVGVIHLEPTISPDELTEISINRLFDRPYNELETTLLTQVGDSADTELAVVTAFERDTSIEGYLLDKDGMYYSVRHSLETGKTDYDTMGHILGIQKSLESRLHENDITHHITSYLNQNGVTRVLIVLKDGMLIDADIINKTIEAVNSIVTEVEVYTLSKEGYTSFEEALVKRGHFNEYILDGYLQVDLQRYSSNIPIDLCGIKPLYSNTRYCLDLVK